MIKTSVGQSVLTDSFASGVESAEKAYKKTSNPSIAFLFTSVMYDQDQVVKGVKKVIGEVPVIGCTSTGGLITPTGIISSDKGFSGLMIVEGSDMKVGVAASDRINGDARATGAEVAKAALKNAGKKDKPDYCLVFCGLRDQESYIDGVQDVLGRVPIFGGSAADDALNGDWRVICNSQDFADGIAIALFYTNDPFEVEFTGSYIETNKVGIITKTDGKRIIQEIDNAPALKKLASWLDTDPDSLIGTNLLLASCRKPIGVKDPTGLIRLTRLPWIGSADYSVRLGNDIAPNTAIFALEANTDLLIEGSRDTITDLNQKLGGKGKGFLLFHSISRKFGIGERLNEIYNDIKFEVGNKPFLVVFTFGEYGFREHSANHCSTGMLTYVGFGK